MTCEAPASRARHVARDLPALCAGTFLGKQRRQFIGNLSTLQPSAHRGGPPPGCTTPGTKLIIAVRSGEGSIPHNSKSRFMTEIAKLTANGELELDFDRATVEQAYDRWAPVYDLVFGGVFSKGRRPPSSPPTPSAAVCSKSASAPGSRCRSTHRICASSGPTSRRRCCARPRRASPISA